MIYRGAGAWGAGKGGNLTPAEVDGNFYELRVDLDAVVDDLPAPAEIDTITVVGGQMTIVLSDARSFGPYTLPRATFRYRGDYEAANNYFANDFISVPGVGVYIVLISHTSEATFNPARVISSQPVYLLMYAEPRSQVVNVTASTFDPLLTHVWGYIRCANTCEVFLPANAELAFPIGSELHFRQVSGAVDITPETGVTLSVPAGFIAQTAQAGAVLTCKKVATNTWDVFGWLAVEVVT